jgi:hypothetical protein
VADAIIKAGNVSPENGAKIIEEVQSRYNEIMKFDVKN